MTARLLGAVSAVTTTMFPQSTGEDQPLPRGTFQSVVFASTVTGRPEVSELPVPLGPRNRFHSVLARATEGRRRAKRAAWNEGMAEK